VLFLFKYVRHIEEYSGHFIEKAHNEYYDVDEDERE
jgi:hypothetical protein